MRNRRRDEIRHNLKDSFKKILHFQTDLNSEKLPEAESKVGIDVGLKVSNSNIYENPKHLRKSEKRLVKLQRDLSRLKKDLKQTKGRLKVAK